MYAVNLMITSGSHADHVVVTFSKTFIVIDRFYFYWKLSAKHVEQKKEVKGKIPNQYLRIAHWGTQIAYISSTQAGNRITLEFESESSTLID